tara:strand:+ start:415 stop:1074 length:660 start_codon:yes stop_codon:yes gene_type:complete
MATRQGLDTSIVNALSESHVFPFVAVKALFDSDPVRVWSGTEDITISSETYTGTGTLLQISGFEETKELKTNGITVTLSAMDETVLAHALAENYQNRKLTVFLGFLDGGTNEVKGTLTAFQGRMTSMSIQDAPTGSIITVNAENRLIDLERPSMLRYNKESQKFIAGGTTDTAFNRVQKLADQEILWGRQSSTSGNLGGGGGSSGGPGGIDDGIGGVMK